MSKTAMASLIVYCSPAGTTRHVAGVIRENMEAADVETFMLDLGEGGDNSLILSQIQKAENLCLFIGSPVYGSRAVPPVMDFIHKLPGSSGIYAIPFVTWGGATSGIALSEMAEALCTGGIRVIGAAKILALHSMMWNAENPLGAGHPDADDDRMIAELVAGICKKMAEPVPRPLDLSELVCLPEAVRTQMTGMSFETFRAHMPEKTVDETRCTQCRSCTDVCPASAITLDPWPQFGAECICCFNCLRECPEGAITADLSGIENRIRARAEQFRETPFTRIFL